MIGLDTNVLVRYLAQDDAAQSAKATRLIEGELNERNPGFNERAYGFRSFNGMLEEAERRGSLKLERDEKSGGYLVRLASNGD